jgi:hypothetical protein
MVKLLLISLFAAANLFAEKLVHLDRSTLGWLYETDVHQTILKLTSCTELKPFNAKLIGQVRWLIKVNDLPEYPDTCGMFSFNAELNMFTITLTPMAFTDEGCYNSHYRATLAHEMMHLVLGGHPNPGYTDNDLQFILDPVEKMMYHCYEKRTKGDIFDKGILKRFKNIYK